MVTLWYKLILLVYLNTILDHKANTSCYIPLLGNDRTTLYLFRLSSGVLLIAIKCRNITNFYISNVWDMTNFDDSELPQFWLILFLKYVHPLFGQYRKYYQLHYWSYILCYSSCDAYFQYSHFIFFTYGSN